MKKTLIFGLLALSTLCLSARPKKGGQGGAVSSSVPHKVILNDEQTQRFDSLYFGALSLQFLQGKPNEAVELLNEALQIDSLSAPALYMRSKLLLATSDGVLPQNRGHWIASAMRDAQLAVQIDSTNYWYSELLSRYYRGTGKLDKAIECMERIVRLHPLKSDPHYTLAELYMRADSLDKCLQMLNRIEELDGVNPNLTMQKFYILSEQKKTDEAFNEYDKLIKRYPYDISYRLQLGEMQMKAGLIPQAKQTYDEASRIDPDNAYLWIAQSTYYSIVGNQQAADSLVQNALVNANLDIQTKVEILTEYLKTTLGKVAQEKESAQDTTAIFLPGVDSLFMSVSTMHPTAPEIYDLHADYLAAIDQDSAATVQMRFAVDLRPSEEKYWSKLMSLAVQSDNLSMALKVADEAKQHHPKLVDIYLTKAFVHLRGKEYDHALSDYEEALVNVDAKEVNLQSRIYGYMGDMFHEKGDKEQCYAYYDKALRFNAQNYAVLNNYAYFLCLDKGDLMKAESMAAKVVQKFPDEPTYLDTYAWIYYLQGNYSLAKFYQEKAIQKLSGEPHGEILEHYNAILQALKEKE